VVVGCGPVGLAVIAALATRDVEPIVAADLSPARRALAGVMGAHHVVDPQSDSAFDVWSRVGGGRQLVVFEAVGVPGMIDDVMRVVPPHSRIVVVGVCMHRDTVTPFFGIGKELDLRFALAYDPMEFEASLRAIAEGVIDVSPMITGQVDLDGVPGAFHDLADPEQHCKILVVP
jgi:threonine dehydrogenase-like Zn-dependent dehydrogenase